MPADRLTVFWIAIGITVLIFFAGLAFKLSFWSHGYVLDAHGRPADRRTRRALAGAAGTTVRRFGAVATHFVLDGLLNRRLWAEDRFRWTAHFLMLFGFLSLFALSTITGFFEEILHLFLGIDTPLVRFITNKDTPLMALLNESLGLLIIVGLALAMLRRFVWRPAQIRTSSFDRSTLIILAVIMLTAYPIESFRLIIDGTPPALAWYSFIGYPLALLIRPLGLNWEVWHYWTFMLHIGACIALAVTMPFSKFFHVLVSPIIATANTLPEPEVDG